LDADLQPAEAEPPSTPRNPAAEAPKNRSRAKVIDKSVLALSEPRRIWDRDHVRYVAKQPCLICGRRPAMPTTCASHKAGCSNESSVMISPSRCAEDTIARCTVSAKSAWWKKAGIDTTENARALWLKTRVPYRQPANHGSGAPLQPPPSARPHEPRRRTGVPGTSIVAYAVKKAFRAQWQTQRRPTTSNDRSTEQSDGLSLPALRPPLMPLLRGLMNLKRKAPAGGWGGLGSWGFWSSGQNASRDRQYKDLTAN
jgi:hypothetical protein